MNQMIYRAGRRDARYNAHSLPEPREYRRISDESVVESIT